MRGKLSDEVAICHAAVESSLDPDATGRQKEIGLFQVKPSLAKKFFRLNSIGTYSAKKAYDPAVNTRIGTEYLDELYGRFHDLRTALGAYKQGAASVASSGLTQASQEYADAVNKCADYLISSDLLK